MAALLLGQGLVLLPVPLQLPLALLQGLALGGQLGLGGVAGAAALAEAGLQLALLPLQRSRRSCSLC